MAEDGGTAKWGGPCADDPQAWDLDAGDLVRWLASIRTCLSCPVLQDCRELRDQHFPTGNPAKRVAGNPRSMIWAGVAYSEAGTPLPPDRQLRVYAARRRAAAQRGAQLPGDQSLRPA